MYTLQCTRTEELEIWMGEFFEIDEHHSKYAEICFPSWVHQNFTKGSFISRDDDKICDKIEKARIFETKEQALKYLRNRINIVSEIDKHSVTSFASVKALFDIVPITIVRR